MNKRINLSALNTQPTPTIHAVQFDTDRYLDCYFCDVDISEVTAARIYGLKPDGTEVYNNCVINDGYITAPLTSQTLAVTGIVACQLQLVIDGTLTSFKFNVVVDESLVSESAIESSNEYTALEEALAEVEDVITGLPAKEDKANKVTELSENSTDIEYPSAKCVYDAIAGIEPMEVDDALSDTSENPVQNKVVKNALDGKLSLSGGTMSGDIAMGNKRLRNVLEIALSSGDGTNPSRITGNASVINGVSMLSGLIAPQGDTYATNKKYVDDADALNEKLANKVTAIGSASTDVEYPSAKAVYDELDEKFDKTGGTITGAVSLVGNLNMNNRQINNLAAPAYPNSAARKQYVDDAIAAALIVDTEEVIP
jgi:3-methyladenine DNA glycosylase AlkC